ncbi:hydantoinase/oxoprolinase family protein [Paraburkholderia sp. BL10I2N1]|uniref:hydantoinase/oxoprolinase family protein n=1 Tax=Paraburkholderia sp. BL10I2N1 TaxID=1938796 RepID=UPI00105B9787|nr:hydantoinase/oxoprolinase family protein [Paraburkholderia sp. BL10I2N1]TDN69361.1 putative H4MPT-linked C1 transfer pathway protein [Paraburkholderia sp. BL10I2N1]
MTASLPATAVCPPLDSSTAGPVFGWDVGGAHVKVSMADASGSLLDVAQWACPLWQGLEHLERAIDLVFVRWPDARAASARHAITMTGEMVDLFADRAEGVSTLTRALSQRLGPRTFFFAGAQGWLAPSACADGWRAVASANWLATAEWVASRVPDALLVDIGSTTTDIIPVVSGRVAASGRNDADRLVSGELVYQGVVRTPLCGVAQRIRFRDQTANVMNEWFAATADVYRLTGELWPPHDQHASADNGPKTEAASRVRLARMIGRDAAEASDAEWLDFAQRWRHEQLATIATNLARVRAAHPALSSAPLVGAGCGRFLVPALAQQDGRSYIDFAALAGVGQAGDESREWIATCAPSVAVALLAVAGARPDAQRVAAPDRQAR